MCPLPTEQGCYDCSWNSNINVNQRTRNNSNDTQGNGSSIVEPQQRNDDLRDPTTSSVDYASLIRTHIRSITAGHDELPTYHERSYHSDPFPQISEPARALSSDRLLAILDEAIDIISSGPPLIQEDEDAYLSHTILTFRRQ